MRKLAFAPAPMAGGLCLAQGVIAAFASQPFYAVSFLAAAALIGSHMFLERDRMIEFAAQVLNKLVEDGVLIPTAKLHKHDVTVSSDYRIL